MIKYTLLGAAWLAGPLAILPYPYMLASGDGLLYFHVSNFVVAPVGILLFIGVLILQLDQGGRDWIVLGAYWIVFVIMLFVKGGAYFVAAGGLVAIVVRGLLWVADAMKRAEASDSGAS